MRRFVVSLPMIAEFEKQVSQTLEEIKSQGLFINRANHHNPSAISRDFATTQRTARAQMCANNYLGLADHPDFVAAAKEGLDPRGFGMAPVCVSFAARRRSTRNWKRNSRISRHGRHDPLFVVLRCQRRFVRNVAGRGRRGHLR